MWKLHSKHLSFHTVYSLMQWHHPANTSSIKGVSDYESLRCYTERLSFPQGVLYVQTKVLLNNNKFFLHVKCFNSSTVEKKSSNSRDMKCCHKCKCQCYFSFRMWRKTQEKHKGRKTQENSKLFTHRSIDRSIDF